MNVRHASSNDLAVLEEIYENAKRFMHTHGNPNQWHQGHPNIEDLKADLEEDSLYVVEDEDGIQGCFKFFIGEDPTYQVIDHGRWLNDHEYGVIHRVASAGHKKRVGDAIIKACLEKYPNLKIDTHQDNIYMQALLKRNGFIHVGTIYLENGDPRLAYQFVKD